MNVEALRAEFPMLEAVAYLNAGTFGPLPRRAVAALAAQARAELEEGRFGTAYWEHVRALRARVREASAALIGADASEVALTRSTSDGCNVAVQGLMLTERDEIVTTDCEHFGLLGALGASRAGVRVARVRDRPPDEALEAIEAEIGPRTRLVAISHVAWSTGHLLPVERLAGRDVVLLVDGAQGAGAIPVDVKALGCDLYTVSGQKWPLGPDGTGALYVAPRVLERLAVTAPSYFGQGGFTEDGRFDPVPGAPRFDTGSIAAPSLAALLAALDFGAGLGPARFGQARAMAERCRELLLGAGIDVVTEAGQSTLVAFRPRKDAAATVRDLAERGVVVRDLPGLGWVRASVGFWTTEDDLLRLVEGLELE